MDTWDGQTDCLNETQMMLGFVEGVYSDVTILLRQHRHLPFFYSPPMTTFLFKRKTILE